MGPFKFSYRNPEKVPELKTALLRFGLEENRDYRIYDYNFFFNDKERYVRGVNAVQAVGLHPWIQKSEGSDVLVLKGSIKNLLIRLFEILGKDARGVLN